MVLLQAKGNTYCGKTYPISFCVYINTIYAVENSGSVL